MTIRIRPLPNPGDQMDMFSWLREAEASLIKAGTPSWSDINFVGSKLSDIASRSHTVLSDIGSNTHSQIDSMLASLQSQINATNSLVASQPWTAHAALTSGVHGAIGSVVGTTDAQPLTNKTYLGINTASGDQYDAITVRGTSVNNTAITLQKLDGTDKVQSSISTTGNGNVSVYDSSGSYNSSINGDQVDISHGSNHVNIYSDGQIALNNTVGANSYIQIPQQGIINIGPGTASGDWRMVCPSAGGNLLTQRYEVDGSWSNGTSSNVFMDFNQNLTNAGSITGGPFYSFAQNGTTITYSTSPASGYDYVANLTSGSTYISSNQNFNAAHGFPSYTKNTMSIWMSLSDVTQRNGIVSNFVQTGNGATNKQFSLYMYTDGIHWDTVNQFSGNNITNETLAFVAGSNPSNGDRFHIQTQFDTSTNRLHVWLKGYYLGYFTGGVTRLPTTPTLLGRGAVALFNGLANQSYFDVPGNYSGYGQITFNTSGAYFDELVVQENTLIWTQGQNYTPPSRTSLVWITKHTITP